MNDPKEDYCNHEWDSDALARVCFRCGQVRLFPSGGENPRVLWPGRETEDLPSQLPKADKALIAGVAKRRGFTQTAGLTGIRMAVLRAWYSGSRRITGKEQITPTEPPAPPPVPPETEVEPEPLLKKQRHSYFETNREVILNDVRRCGRTEALKAWDISQSTFTQLAKRWGVVGIGIMRSPPSADQKEKPQMDINYQLLKARFEGYRQAVIDMSGGKEDCLLS